MQEKCVKCKYAYICCKELGYCYGNLTPEQQQKSILDKNSGRIRA